MRDNNGNTWILYPRIETKKKGGKKQEADPGIAIIIAIILTIIQMPIIALIGGPQMITVLILCPIVNAIIAIILMT